jgi:signal transduction histidine kinase
MTSRTVQSAKGAIAFGRHGRLHAASDDAESRGIVAPTRGRLVAVAAVAVVAALGAGTVTAQSDVLAAPAANGVFRGVAIASWIAAGLVTWKLRPRDRLGLLLIVAGFVFLGTTLLARSEPALFTLGRVVWASVAVLLVYILLAFPHGSLELGAPRTVFRVMLWGTVLLWTPLVIGARDLPIGAVLTRCDGSCPQNPFRVADLGVSTANSLARAAALLTSAVALAAAVLIVKRLPTIDGLVQRTLVPAFACLLTWALGVGVSNTLRSTVGDEPVALAIGWIGVGAALCFPLAMLLGQVRGRLFAGAAARRALGELVRREQGREVRDVLADALGDPSLELYFWTPELHAYVDPQGLPAALGDVGERSVTEVGWGGERVAAIVHKRTLDESPGATEAAAAGAMLALENAGLAAELRASNEALRASRRRIFAAGAAERRRIERDLHDGAQNRLVALRIELGLAADRAAALAADDLQRTLVGLGEEAQEALDGVRTIAHGIYPPLLVSRGLREALAAEADRSAIPVRLVGDEVARSTPDVEAAVYFCCLEAIQNACKHAGPGATITVRVGRAGERLAFAIEDDGVGFDPPARGSSVPLMHVRDRISAVGGELEVRPAPVHGTVVEGAVPWPKRAAEP